MDNFSQNSNYSSLYNTPNSYPDGSFGNIPEIVKSYAFTRRERVSAFFAAVLGFLFIKLTAAPLAADTRMGLGTTLFLLGLMIFTAAYPAKRGINAGKTVRMIIAAAFAVNVFISSNLLIQLLDTIFVLLTVAYDGLASSDGKFSKIRSMFPADLFSAVMILPFHDYGACHQAIRTSAEKTKAGSGLKNALLGLAIALPSTIAVCVLLMSADDGFSRMIGSFTDNVGADSFVFTFQFLISLPVGYYIYGLCRSSEQKYSVELIDDERCMDNVRSVRFLPSFAGFFSVLPVCVLYVIFFFSQLSYYISSFASKLPSDMPSYAEYARRGFFELCLVSLINLAMIICLWIFCKYNEDGKRPAALKVITCVLCVFTELLIATAVSKMVMYIDVYGLTLLRVYTTWFMILLAFVFGGIFLIMLNSKINLPRMIVTVFTVMFAALSFCNVDGIIAKYNADRFMSGTLREFDVDMMRELSTGAIPEAVQVTGYLSKEDREKFFKIISEKIDTAQKNDERSLTLSDIIAERKNIW